MERIRKISLLDMSKYGCIFCHDRELLERECPRETIKIHVKGKRTPRKGYIKAHDILKQEPMYCPYRKCAYRDILDKYNSYSEFNARMEAQDEAIFKYLREAKNDR